MARDMETVAFEAKVTIELTPVNRYGDHLAENPAVTYSRVLKGSLGEIVTSFERMGKA